MTRCAACRHPDVDAIEAALAAGTSAREVARRFGLGRGIIARHVRHIDTVTAEPSPDLLDPDPGRRAMASLDASLDVLERAEAHGRLPLLIGALRGARSAARAVARLSEGPVSDEDRIVVEQLYIRAVACCSRAVGRGGLELSALSALRGILDDVRAAAGEVEGEVFFTMGYADGSTFRGEDAHAIPIPASKLPPALRDGGVIRLRWPGGPSSDGDFTPPEPEGGNGNGHR